MGALFEALFKFRPLLFREGELAFATPWPMVLLLLTAVVIAGVAVATYGSARGRTSPGDRTVLATLRLAALGVLTFCLMQPTLILSSAVDQRNFVGILIDDSRSMTLPGEDDAPRSAFAAEAFGAESALVEALSERFALRYFRFSHDAGRVPGPEALAFDGTRTDLPSALDRAREELSSVPLSGLVVVSDGADNAGRPLAEAMVPLQAASIPVFTVGVGDEAIDPDIQIGPVELPRTVLEGSALVVDVLVSHRGFEGARVPVVVEDGGLILVQDTVTLEGDDEPAVARVRFSLDEAGPRRIRVRVPNQEGEAVTRNNVREVAVEVESQRQKILYFEGEPRYEVKFIRRAIADDPNVQVVVLQRTADNKFLRLDVDGPEELVDGFPDTREELFAYQGLILGSVEASFFTTDQLRMIADFVSERGGGLLALGGRNALAEGGYAGTAVDEVLPVVLEEPASDPRRAYTEIDVGPTPAGRSHPAAQLRTSDETPDSLWAALPPLSTLNRIERVKPGATPLLTGVHPGGERVVLAHQRYGRGKALAFPVQDSWMWQMHADVPLDDLSHETLWQQLLRWVVEGVPSQVEVASERDAVEPGERVRITAEVLDSTYLAINDASVVASITGPDGSVVQQVMDWTVDEDGVYATEVLPDAAGRWTVDISAAFEGEIVGSGVLHLEAGPGDAEYFDAGRRTAVLERLAEETGGQYYTPATISSLPEDLQYTGAGVTITEEHDLWDMPFLFLLLLGLIGAEWSYRRMRGLV
ncbi:hypothetical protein WI372_10225 [Gemmatimonadota bacterium DH-20]|uniref:Glutamine amidotransferase domain-containing protein n=1 Tax=Gaopeijia maritima TaxID=3119007 RepID=A0ABU9E9X7_9BACT